MKDKTENKEVSLRSDEVNRYMQWCKILNEYKIEIEKEVEQRIQKRLKEEEEKKKIEEHQKLYPIGSFVEYLGLTMMIKDNLDFSTWRDYIKKDQICVKTEWKDKLDQLQRRIFWPDEFKYLKKDY